MLSVGTRCLRCKMITAGCSLQLANIVSTMSTSRCNKEMSLQEKENTLQISHTKSQDWGMLKGEGKAKCEPFNSF